MLKSEKRKVVYMFKNKRLALSPIGIAIAIVCLLALVMIFSAPMVVDKYKNDEGGSQNIQNPSNADSAVRVLSNSELTDRIEQLNNRIEDIDRQSRNLEQNINNQINQRNPANANSYNCSIEGVVDANGEMIPASQVKSTTPDTKYVFVCSKQ